MIRPLTASFTLRSTMNTPDTGAASPIVPPLGPMRLASDLRIAYLVLNEARYRTMKRAFGLRRDQVNLASLVALAMAAAAVREGAHKMTTGPAFPAADGTAFAIAGLREVVQTVARPASPDASMPGTLVAVVAVAGACVVPLARRTVRAFGHGTHRAELAFRHRYGLQVARTNGRSRGSPGTRP